MRKIISLILCLVMLVAVFAACNKTEAPADDSEESKAPANNTDTEDTGDAEVEGTPVGNGTLVLGTDPIEITWWIQVNDSSDEGEMAARAEDELVAGFMEKYPNVTINLEGISANSSDSSAVVAAAAAANNLPELLTDVDGHIVQWQEGDIIVDYSKYLSDDYYAAFQNGAINTANAFATTNGAVYIAPTVQEVEGWIFNTKILSENDLEVPVTWDDMLNAVATLKSNDILPICQGGADNWALWGYHLIVNQYGWTQDDCIKFETGDITIVDTAFYDQFQRVIELQEAGAYASDVNTTLYDTATAMFVEGRGAMFQTFDS